MKEKLKGSAFMAYGGLAFVAIMVYLYLFKPYQLYGVGWDDVVVLASIGGFTFLWVTYQLDKIRERLNALESDTDE